MLSIVTFGLFLDESDCCVIILFSISSWDFWVLFELNSEIEGPVRGLNSRIEGHVIGYATSVGFRLLAIGHCCLIISSKIAQGLQSVMERKINDNQQGMDFQEDEFMDQQHLFISVNSLNSTISFVLDTLVQHWDMVEQLEDEVASLRSQVEAVQL